MHSVHLDVPLFRQPADSRLCGPYSVKMALAAFDDRVSTDTIVRDLRCTHGSWEIQLAAWLARRGYAVTAFMWSDLFPTSFLNDAENADLNERRMREWSRRRISTTTFHANERAAYRRHLPSFFDHGGRYVTRPFQKKDVRDALRSGSPPIVGVDAATFTKGRLSYDPHYLVVTGMDDATFTVNDPNYERSGGVKTYAHDELLFSAYRTDGSMIVAHPDERRARRFHRNLRRA